MLIKFDKMPGIRLSPGGGVKFGFDAAASSENDADGGGDGQSAKAAELRLCGLSGSPLRRLAIINNLTFGEGETVRILCGATNVNVRCVEIRTNSVIAQREDVSSLIELFLGNTRPKLHALTPGTNVTQPANLLVQAASGDPGSQPELPRVLTGATAQVATTNFPPVQLEEER